jgi:hypothetical protein
MVVVISLNVFLTTLTVTKNYVLPAGATIVIGTYKIHRNPAFYKNPDVFNPDNFLPENTQNRHYYSFIPFSAGPRSCVGMLLHVSINIFIVVPHPNQVLLEIKLCQIKVFIYLQNTYIFSQIF